MLIDMRPGDLRVKKYEKKLDGTISQLRLLRYGDKQKGKFRISIQEQVRIEQIVKSYLMQYGINPMYTHFYMDFAKKCVGIRNKHSGDVAQNESLIEENKWISRGLDSVHLENIRKIFIPITIIITEEIMSWMRFRRVGWYHNQPIGAATTTTQALVANRFYVFPFYVPGTQSFDRIAVYVSTLSAGQIRLGVYEDNGQVYPGTLVVDAGTVDSGTTGTKTLTISEILTDKLYWTCLIGNSTPTLYGVASTSAYAPLGSAAPGGTNYTGYYKDSTYGSLPSEFPAGASSSIVPIMIWLRRS